MGNCMEAVVTFINLDVGPKLPDSRETAFVFSITRENKHFAGAFLGHFHRLREEAKHWAGCHF